jgi:very-short-patch-repair endonuclease
MDKHAIFAAASPYILLLKQERDWRRAGVARFLVVERAGGRHAEAQSRDERRTRCLGARGYRVLRFSNNAVMEKREGVVAATGGVL